MTLARIWPVRAVFLTLQSLSAQVARVPFVGCPSDGQTGPLHAPTGTSKVVQMSVAAAKRLAYYQAEIPPGVIAPRGWHCFGAYGSNAHYLLVVPQPISGGGLFSSNWRGIAGPAIEISWASGETYGRFEVARMIARVFPKWEAFAQDVIKEGIEPASDFPSGPYPKDKLVYRSERIVEYETPRHSERLGTMSQLQTNGDPIKGVPFCKATHPTCCI